MGNVAAICKTHFSPIILSLFFFVFLSSNLCYGNSSESLRSSLFAVIKEPVIEMSTSFPPPYNQPASPDLKKCSRAHQGLFNEIVEIIEVQDDFCKIACPKLAYGIDGLTRQILNTFWINNKDVIMLNDLDSSITSMIPHPLYAREPTIVLIYPWQQFSVGTRFKHLPVYDIDDSYAIAYLDFENNQIKYNVVPRSDGLPEINLTLSAARHLFVTLINNLVDRVALSEPGHVIPYVWGGSSFLFGYSHDDFFNDDGAWQRNGSNGLYAGYDCSEFVMRMAQIAGICFPWKTTSAMEKSLHAFSDEDVIEEGDLIWIPGHVMIISNCTKNEIIQSRSYSSGYGCVYRCAVSECLADINSLSELHEWYKQKKKIRLKNKRGMPAEKENPFKLLKLINP